MHPCAKFGENWTNSNEMAAKNVKTRWRRRPSWIFDQYFRFCIFPFRHYFMHLCFKFHQNPSIFGRVIAISVFSRWPPPPSWIPVSTSVFLYFTVSCWFAYILKISWWSVNQIKSYCTFRSRPLIMGFPIQRPQFRRFWGATPPNVKIFQQNPQKALSWDNTRRLSHQPLKSGHRLGL